MHHYLSDGHAEAQREHRPRHDCSERAASLPRHAEFDLIALSAMAHPLFIRVGIFLWSSFFHFLLLLVVERGKAALPEKFVRSMLAIENSDK